MKKQDFYLLQKPQNESKMKESKQEITAFTLWSQTLGTMKSGLKDSLLFGFWFLFIPGVFFSLFFRGYSHHTVSLIKETTDKMAHNLDKIDYRIFYHPTTEFITIYALTFCLLLILFVASYVAFTLIAFENLDYYKISYKNPRNLLKKSLRLSFPKAFIILLAVFFLSSEKVLFGPIRIFSLLALVAINLILTEKKGALASLWQAITLKYISQKKGMGFTTFWIVLSTGALLYLYEYMVALITSSLLVLDKKFVSLEGFLSYRPSFLPCSWFNVFVDGIYFVAYLFLIIFIANFISCLYVTVGKKLSEKK